MGKIALALKKIISSSGRRFFWKSSGRRFFQKVSGRTICVLPEEPFSGRTFFRKLSERRFFRKNKLLFFWKKVLPESFQKKVLPIEQFILPKEGSSG